jgi:cathepsin F
MLLIYLILNIVCISFQKIEQDEKFQEFIEYTKKYNKNYSNPQEFQSRFKIWKKNYNIIKRNNPTSDGSSGAQFSLNEFSDMTEGEFTSKYLTLDPEIYRDLATLSSQELGLNDVDAPEEFDWEYDRGIKTEVKHQRDCGGCWAFATTAVIESQYMMKYGNNISLSEQQLIDCDENNLKCEGGNMRKAFLYLQENGLMKSEDYPFINGEGECKYDENKAVIKVKEFNFVPKDEEEMKKALFKYGPLAGAINGIMMAFYEKGVYEPWFSSLCPDNINHAVVIVGYGIDKETNKQFWRVKNSWGPQWGENGYFRIIRGEGICGIKRYNLIVEIEKFE